MAFLFFFVFGGEFSGGAVAMVWWVWCKKVYSMVVFGMICWVVSEFAT